MTTTTVVPCTLPDGSEPTGERYNEHCTSSTYIMRPDTTVAVKSGSKSDLATTGINLVDVFTFALVLCVFALGLLLIRRSKKRKK